MARDEVANIVITLQKHGFDPRRVGSDAWEARCPGHRSKKDRQRAEQSRHGVSLRFRAAHWTYDGLSA
jgi:hypothetical protein